MIHFDIEFDPLHPISYQWDETMNEMQQITSKEGFCLLFIYESEK